MNYIFKKGDINQHKITTHLYHTEYYSRCILQGFGGKYQNGNELFHFCCSGCVPRLPHHWNFSTVLFVIHGKEDTWIVLKND